MLSSGVCMLYLYHTIKIFKSMSDHTIHTQKVDTHSYKGWLNSDSFWKRAFAILGYSTVAGLIVSIPFILSVLLWLWSSSLLCLDL